MLCLIRHADLPAGREVLLLARPGILLCLIRPADLPTGREVLLLARPGIQSASRPGSGLAADSEKAVSGTVAGQGLGGAPDSPASGGRGAPLSGGSGRHR
jgi:hypothetical protein